MHKNKDQIALADAILVGGVVSTLTGTLLSFGLGAAFMALGAILTLFWLLFTE